MTFRTALLAATAAVVLPALAQAQPVNGPYLAGTAFLNLLVDADTRSPGIPRRQIAGTNNTIEFEPGGGATLALGWGFGNGMRVELEGGYRGNHVDDVSGTGGGQAGGNVRAWTGMVNALYDFPLGGVMPYVGLGIGYAQVEYDRVGRVGFAQIDSDDGGLAYQGMVGVGLPLDRYVRGLTGTIEYRYVAAQELTMRDNLGRNIDVDWANHSIGIGLRYAFGRAPAPAPAPVAAAPAPAPARTYLVFFDWDRADLTDRARGTIREAATTSAGQQVTRIEVSGHADRSGAEPYNMRLSRRRADNVAGELVRNGVARNQIFVQAFGETRPLVPTADGVREPQNRRVEIVLR